jgi:phosphatidylserine/phosphatidylglycerophosphate/cardiolipin synthase-like enzyme
MILKPGRNCWQLCEHGAAGALVDARDYYLAFYRAAEAAQQRILLSGWQFDSTVKLLRGDDAQGEADSELLPFLNSLVARKPELSIWILAWDYSLVYALERQWLQRVIFDWRTDERIHFHFDSRHAMGGSHHQKFVVVDGQLGFAGGIDLCESRWDDRRHLPQHPERCNKQHKPQKPYHDLMAFVTGDAAKQLEGLFCARWQEATGETLPLLPAAPLAVPEFEGTLPIRCERVAISRTEGEVSDLPVVDEILKQYEDAIAAAERLIYIETQYFTSRAVQRAFLARLHDASRSRLAVVIVMPKGADTPKENMALGDAQNKLLASLCESAAQHGHQLRAYYTSTEHEGEEVPTFIHSKVLVVDDRLLSIGSANLTNRSMHLDTELNLTWECEGDEDPLSATIRTIRASLLAEHAGIADTTPFEAIDGLIDRLDALGGSPDNRLRPRSIPESADSVDTDPLMERAFDPSEPLDEIEIPNFLLKAERRD